MKLKCGHDSTYLKCSECLHQYPEGHCPICWRSMKEELDGILETYHNIVNSPCDEREVHCSCVPALRAEMDTQHKKHLEIARLYIEDGYRLDKSEALRESAEKVVEAARGQIGWEADTYQVSDSMYESVQQHDNLIKKMEEGK